MKNKQSLLLRNKPVTFAFIDASNLMYGATREGWKVDFAKLMKYLKTRYQAQKVFYYAGLDPENKKQLGFYEKLQEFGYTLRLVPLKTFSDGTRKGDVDSRMTFEIMKYFGDYNQTVILTGDGDYYWVLEYLMEQKKKVKILSFRRRTAQELKRLVGEEFTDFSRLREILQFNLNKQSFSSNKNAADAFKGSTAGVMSRGYHKIKNLSRGKK